MGIEKEEENLTVVYNRCGSEWETNLQNRPDIRLIGCPVCNPFFHKEK